MNRTFTKFENKDAGKIVFIKWKQKGVRRILISNKAKEKKYFIVKYNSANIILSLKNSRQFKKKETRIGN